MMFSHHFFSVQFKYEKNLKIWKSKMAATCDIIYVAVIAMETS